MCVLCAVLEVNAGSHAGHPRLPVFTLALNLTVTSTYADMTFSRAK